MPLALLLETTQITHCPPPPLLQHPLLVVQPHRHHQALAAAPQAPVLQVLPQALLAV